MTNHLNFLQTLRSNNQKALAVLIDPEKIKKHDQLDTLIQISRKNPFDFFFIGGSIVSQEQLSFCMDYLEGKTEIPLVLFPGSSLHINEKAHALLFLSLVSGRNPEYLIGHQVAAAKKLQKSSLEIMATGYILVDSGKLTTVQYVSDTKPIPRNNHELAISTGLAAQYMGMQLLYMDAGSGAEQPIPEEMIGAVKSNTKLPMIIGGGIRNVKEAEMAWTSGADVVVVGNAIENNPTFIEALSQKKQQLNL